MRYIVNKKISYSTTDRWDCCNCWLWWDELVARLGYRLFSILWPSAKWTKHAHVNLKIKAMQVDLKTNFLKFDKFVFVKGIRIRDVAMGVKRSKLTFCCKVIFLQSVKMLWSSNRDKAAIEPTTQPFLTYEEKPLYLYPFIRGVTEMSFCWYVLFLHFFLSTINRINE